MHRKKASWLATARVAIPERVDGYLRRPQLLRRCQPIDRRLTVFHAPCGFGKTTLLADICRRERAHGVLAAWLSLEEADTLDVLAAYIEHALRHAGLDASAPRSAGRRPSETGGPAESAVRPWMGVLMRAMDDYRKSILFALDEVERLADPAQIRLIDLLVRRAPPNVHFAMAMRQSPPGLDLASEVVDGRGEFYRAEDLRFSKPEIALYFDGRLSRSELAEMTERTEGWPAALQIYRNARDSAMIADARQEPGAEPVEGYVGMAARSISVRLRRDMDDGESEYLLDLSLLDEIDPIIASEVLPETHTKYGANLLSRIEGLVQPDDTEPGTLRLHPLVREYCAVRRFQNSPARFRMLHGRIAAAMERRGRLISALGHAADSGDHALVGQILEAAGGVQLWCRYGMEQFFECDRFLTERVLEDFPRLVFLRCAALVARADLEQALALYMAVGEKTMGFRHDRKGGDDIALRTDSILMRSTLAIFGCERFGSDVVNRVLEDADTLAADERLDPMARGMLYTILCNADYQRARFERGQWLGMRAKQCLALVDARYGVVFNDFHLGLMAMAEGRAEEAARMYARRSPALISRVLMAELDLERNRLKPDQRLAHRVPLRIVERGIDVHAAAYGVVAERAFERKGAAGALRVLEDSLDFAAAEKLPSLVRHLSALRVSHLVIRSDVASARRAWSDAGLPDCDSEMLDLDSQTWREMESICSARIRLLEARHEIEAARHLAEKLREVARERGLMRTRMRCLALWMSLEYRSGSVNAAASRLLEFLDLVRVADYTRPLVRESEVSATLLRRVLGTALQPRLRASAEMVRNCLDHPDAQRADGAPLYTARELEVIERVARGLQDKQIARYLGLTEHGVRYHLKNIFRKIGATSRMDAVQRARRLGIIG